MKRVLIILPALALAAACTTVGACSTNQDTGDNPATGVSASPTVDKGPVDPHTTVVDDTAEAADAVRELLAAAPAGAEDWRTREDRDVVLVKASNAARLWAVAESLLQGHTLR